MATSYVLVKDSRVLNGPRGWNSYSFQDTLKELGIDASLPASYTDDTPIHINNGEATIYPAVLVYQTYNPKITHLHGPFWDFANNVATGTFQLKDNSIDAVKNDLIARVAANRYRKEVAGTTYNLNGTTVFVDTSRDGRNIFIQALGIMPDGMSVGWKFPEGWFTITKADLAGIVGAGFTHIQTQFGWESSTVASITAATTLAELDAIDLGDPVQTTPGSV